MWPITRKKTTLRAVAAIATIAAAGLWGVAEAQAQTGQITGTVTNASNGGPVTAVTVSVQGTTLLSLTGANGSYTISNVPVGTRTLVITRIGFEALNRPGVTVAAGQPTVVNISLAEQALQLDAIVATGLVDPVSGRQSPISVGRVSRENMPNPVAGSMLQNLQGQIAGVSVARSSGQPGEEVEIQLRSPTVIGGSLGNEDSRPSTAPLIVVDGVIVQGGTVNLESMDILSMEVVRGAAGASLYGSRANNGVIAITTNRGAGLAQGQTQLSYRAEYGFQSAIKGLELPTHHHYQVGDPGDGTFTWLDGGVAVPRDDREVESTLQYRQFQDNEYPTQLYDNVNNVWDPGSYQHHTFNLSQNAVDTNFFLSLNRLVESGSLPNNDGYSRNSFRLNLDHRFLDALSLSVSTFHSRDVRDGVAASLTNLLAAPRDVDLRARPVTPEDSISSACFAVNCRYTKFPDPDSSSENPLWTEAIVQDDTRRVRTTASAVLRWEPASWVQLTGSASYDREDSVEEEYLPRGIDDGGNADGELHYDTDVTDAWNADFQVQFRRQFGGLNARLSLRGSTERSSRSALDTDGSDFLISGLKTYEAMAQANSSASSSQSQDRSNGFLVDTALEYEGRYIGTILFRRDGSSLFGPGERTQNYYRVAGRWRMAEEEWFPWDAFDEFSLNISRGTAGGRPGFSAQYEVWSLNNGVASYGQLGNRNLKPSKTTEHDITLQAVVGRWEVTTTYAWQETVDQLRSVELLGFFGYTTQWRNLGAVKGKTVELTVNGQVFQNENFQWNTTVVADHSNSEITSWPRPLACSGAESWRYRCEGHGIYEVWGYNFVDNTSDFASHRDGELLGSEDQFDINDDGFYVWTGGVDYQEGAGPNETVGDADDLWGTTALIGGRTYHWGIPFREEDAGGTWYRREIGDGQHWNVGWINNFNFGALSFHTQMNAKIGGDVQNTQHQYLIPSYNSPAQDQFGKPEGLKKPQSYWTELHATFGGSSFFNEDGSYLKLRQVSVNYRLTSTQLARFGMSNVGVTGLTVGLIGRNLWTLTNYSGWDPEAGLSLSGGTQTAGLGSYPPTRSYTAEFQVTF